jgi:hypothetical protein
VLIDNFSKFVVLYPTSSTTALSYVQALLHFVGFFGVMRTLRTDGGTQFTATICKDLSRLLRFDHLVVVPYHPEGNGLVERCNNEIMKHLRAIVLDSHVLKDWSLYLPLVQKVINFSFHSSIGTYPAKILFGDMIPDRFPLLIEVSNDSTPVSDYLAKLSEKQTTIVALSHTYLEKEAQARQNLQPTVVNPTSFHVGDYILVTYPTRPPSKLASLYRGPLIIIEKLRDDIFQCMDLVTSHVIDVHVDRLRLFQVPDNYQPQELIQLAAADRDEYLVDAIVDHVGKSKRDLEFRVRWTGLDASEDTWLRYRDVKDLAALDTYSQAHPDLGLG